MPKYFGSDLPPISQLEKRAKLALINANPIIDNLGPMLPTVIPIAGVHISEVKKLPVVRLNKNQRRLKSKINSQLFKFLGFGIVCKLIKKGHCTILAWIKHTQR